MFFSSGVYCQPYLKNCQEFEFTPISINLISAENSAAHTALSKQNSGKFAHMKIKKKSFLNLFSCEDKNMLEHAL
jgi:hypothetical protein